MTYNLDTLVSRHAAHVDLAWAHGLILELRLRGASGADIGAARAEVEAHMAERGGDVRAAFGDPQEYAAALQLPDSQRWTRTDRIWLFPTLVAFGIGAFLTVGGLVGLLLDGFSVSWWFPLGLTAAILLIWCFTGVARLAVERPVIAFLGGGLLIAGVAPLNQAPGPRWEPHPLTALLVGLAALALAALLSAVHRRRAGSLEDPLSFPTAQQGSAVDREE